LIDRECLALAKRTIDLILELCNNPGALESNIIPETRKTRNHSMTMIREEAKRPVADPEDPSSTGLVFRIGVGCELLGNYTLFLINWLV